MQSFWIWLVVRLVEPVGSLIGFLWFDVFRIRRKIAIDNVAIAFPELSRQEQTAIARSSLRHLGRTLMEYFYFPVFEAEDFARMFEFRGMENVEAARAQGTGVFFLCMHLGNGDLSTAAAARAGLPMSLISKVFKTKWLNDLWFRIRKRHGSQYISPEKSSFEILRAVKAKRIVVFVQDQYMGPPVGCRTKFFGKETGTAMGLAVMTERTKCPVIPVCTYRKPNGHHVVEFEPPIPWREHDVQSEAGSVAGSAGQGSASEVTNITVMTQVYTDKIEEIIRRHPEQWMWIHRRWKNFG